MSPALERPFWSRSAGEMLATLGSSRDGLTARAARERLRRIGPNRVGEQSEARPWRLLVKQLESPLVLILVFGAGVSLLLRDWIDAAIILSIVAGSAALGFYQEFRASKAVAELRGRLALKSRVIRGGTEKKIATTSIVPGDIVLLSAGNLIPADGLLLEAEDFLVTEAGLTGESFPVEKRPGTVAPEASAGARSNAVFMGSSVRSGTARALIVETGARTAFGAIAARLRAREPETDFARGVRRFGTMLVRIMSVIAIAVFAANQLLGRPVAEALLFSVALAVGLSPELLPAIVTVTLSAGARELARNGVIVRRLEAIENLGGMDVLCTDKTGTLTSGEIVLDAAVDSNGFASEEVLRLAFTNSALETGIENPLDAAVLACGAAKGISAASPRKVDEIPYDFGRRRLSIVVEEEGKPGTNRLISKGAFANILAVCDKVDRDGEERPLDDEARASLDAMFRERSEEGFRVLALASATLPAKADYTRGDEACLTFRGFLLFLDPPKSDAAETLRQLKALGIAVKVVSGDNRHITAHVARAVGLDAEALLTGEQVAALSDEALWHVLPRTDLFVEIDPQQKERIVRALGRIGHSVGYLGDGINDAPALRAADVGISVDGAVEVARESADVILLRSDLGVLRQGVIDGRRTFVNTLKYISITTSANFGNMVSMAVATPFLPFLPLLPKQILLNNFLSDLPSAAISTDTIDPETVERPQRWNVAEVRRFMLCFGLISSFFDLLTFATLLFFLGGGAELFRTFWFLVSLLTELGVVLVLRTRRPFLRSTPGRLLLWGTLGCAAATLTVPFLGGAADLFGFVPLRPLHLLAVLAIVASYLAATEMAKRLFNHKAD